MNDSEIDAVLDSIFGNPETKHGLGLYSENDRHKLPLLVKAGKVYLHCPISNKDKLAKPEEVVRQLEIAYAVQTLGYNLNQISVEVAVKMGSTYASKAADIVVYTDSTKLHPRIIFECKKPNRLDGLDQLHSYMNATGVYFGAWVNGSTRVNQLTSNPNIFESVINVPSISEDEDDIKSPLKKPQLIGLEDLKDEVRYLENTVLANAGVSTFDEIFKLIFSKLYDEATKGDDEALEFRTTTAPLAEQYVKFNALFKKATEEWPDIFSDTEKIDLSPPALVAVASEFQDKRFFDADLDVIDAAFEYLINPEQKGDKGQYFTPRPVVKMCVKMLNPKLDDQILDPACGPAGFLIHSLNWVTEHAIQPRFPLNVPKKKSDYATKRLFGIDFDARLVKVARAMMLIAGDGRSNIYRVSALDSREWAGRPDGLEAAIKDRQFDIVLTNPPFAGAIKQPEVLAGYDLSFKGNPNENKRSSKMTRDVLFIERCMRFLKPGGRMAIVLPQGNLNNVRAEYLRSWLRDQARLLAVVGLSENTFKKFTNTKTSVVFLQKWLSADAVLDDYEVFMAINRRPVKDSSGRYNYRRAMDGTFEVDGQGNRIIDHDLDEIADEFIGFAKEQKLGMWS